MIYFYEKNVNVIRLLILTLKKMKSTKIVVSIAILFAVYLLASCGPSSVKGKWTDADKTALKTEMEKQDMSKLGDAKDKFVECYISKVEQAYESIDAASKDEPGITKLAEECTTEILAETVTTAVETTTVDTTKTAADTTATK